jgi:hypothetical protein
MRTSMLFIIHDSYTSQRLRWYIKTPIFTTEMQERCLHRDVRKKASPWGRRWIGVVIWARIIHGTRDKNQRTTGYTGQPLPAYRNKLMFQNMLVQDLLSGGGRFECQADYDLPVFLIVYPSIYCSTVLFLVVGTWPFFSSLILYTDGRTPCMRDKPITRLLPTHRKTLTQNKRRQIHMPWVGFEPTIPAFERAKTLHVLDRAATVIVFSWL